MSHCGPVMPPPPLTQSQPQITVCRRNRVLVQDHLQPWKGGPLDSPLILYLLQTRYSRVLGKFVTSKKLLKILL